MRFANLIYIILLFVLAQSEDDDDGVASTFSKIYETINKEFRKYTKRGLHNSRFDKAIYFPQPSVIGTQYDFIVIGGGSAGSVIANRLSEVPGWKVLLLEAGKVENIITDIPAMVTSLQFTKYNWGYQMEPQSDFAWGMNRHTVFWPRGKALGGTSVINFMIYSRGNPHDYDLWEAQGNPGWSYQKVLPYFMKSENSTLRHADYRYHGVDGYLSVENTYQSSLADIFVNAGGEMGYHKYVDYNSPYQIGYSRMQATTKHGRRHSTARAFLEPIKHRHNLDIVTEAFVTKILIDPNTYQTHGVEFKKKGNTHLVYAQKEVVLSAGVINSPQLLMLSGIGPRYHLQEMGIPVLVDLPVGETLYDHIFYFGLNFIPNVPLSVTFAKVIDPIQIKTYFETGEGPLSTIGNIEGIALVNTNVTKHLPYPDMELALFGGVLVSDLGLFTRRILNIRNKYFKAYWGHLFKSTYFSIYPTLLHPKSSGCLRLRSKDPHDHPFLYGNYLSDPEGKDLKTLIAGIRMARDLVHTKAFQRFDVRLDDIPVPGCESYVYDSDAYWECAIRTFTYSYYHQTGTAKMGSKDDPKSVVDHELKVYGIKGLRVADTSVIPVTLSAHTNAPAIMIGEKASDLIKDTWKRDHHYGYHHQNINNVNHGKHLGHHHKDDSNIGDYHEEKPQSYHKYHHHQTSWKYDHQQGYHQYNYDNHLEGDPNNVKNNIGEYHKKGAESYHKNNHHHQI